MDFSWFKETQADDDGLYSGLVLPPEQSGFIWNLSWLSLASGYYGMTQGHYNLVAVPIGVWITSINYWRSPDYGWRRYADISFVHVSMSYHLFLSLRAEIPFPILGLSGCGSSVLSSRAILAFQKKQESMAEYYLSWDGAYIRKCLQCYSLFWKD